MKYFSIKMNITNRLILGFGSISLVVLLIFGFIIFSLNSSKRITEQNIGLYNPSVNIAEDLHDIINETHMLSKSWVFVEQQSDTPDKLLLKHLHRGGSDSLFFELDVYSKFWPKSIVKQYDELKILIKDTLFEEQKIVMTELNDMDQYADAAILFMMGDMVLEGGELTLRVEQVRKDTEGLVTALVSVREQRNKQMNDSFVSFRLFILFGAVIIIMVAIFATYFTVRNIVLPINKLKNNLRVKSEGSFSKDKLFESRDEVGAMARALNEMSGNILESVSDIKKEAKVLTSRSEEITYSASNIAEGAYTQAANTEEVSASVSQMTESINQNSDNAKQAEAAAIVLEGSISKIGLSVQNTTTAMDNIAKRVKVISEIAKRIDMLAINASIEAARAGVAGKGFGVVANEVRKLAENTGQAAKVIESVSYESVQTAAETRQLIEGILPEISQTLRLVRQITAASIEQGSGIMQVNNAIHELASITQENSASAEELSSNASKLLSQSEHLRKSVSFFKTEE